MLRNMTTEGVWATSIRALRSTVGSYKARKLKGIGFTHTLDGVPPGDYAAIGYDSIFSNASVQEKVVVQKEGGEWKVVGYFLTKTFSSAH